MTLDMKQTYLARWEHQASQQVLDEVIKALQEGKAIPNSFYSLPFIHKSDPKLNLKGAILANLNISKRNLNNILFSYANLREAVLIDCDFDGSELIQTNFTQANLTGCDFHACLMLGVNLSHANLSNAILTNANLIGANLAYTNLTGADLRGANLHDVDLTRTILTDADLSHTKLGRFRDWRQELGM